MYLKFAVMLITVWVANSESNNQFHSLEVNACAVNNGGCSTDTCVHLVGTDQSLCSRGVCTIWGDPHFNPFGQGQVYNFQGEGDYTALRVMGSNATLVQMRFRTCSPGSPVTCTIALAVQDSNTLVIVNASSPLTPSLTINGVKTLIKPGHYFCNSTIRTCPSCSVCYASEFGSESIVVTTPSMIVRYYDFFTLFPSTVITMRNSSFLFNKLEGLCGLWNQCESFCEPTTLQYSTGQFAPSYSGQDVVPFALSWRYDVTHFSLFDYTHESVSAVNPPTPPAVQDPGAIDWPSDVLRQQAEAVCSCLTGGAYQACLFDVAITGSIESARASCLTNLGTCASNGGTEQSCTDSIVGTCPNLCSYHGVCSQVSVSVNATCNCTINYSGADCSIYTPPVCDGGCFGRGTCVASNVCACAPPYTGFNCSTIEPTQPSSSTGSDMSNPGSSGNSGNSGNSIPGSSESGGFDSSTSSPPTSTGGNNSDENNGDCGVLLAGGVCQVGFVHEPDCCHRLSRQTPQANVSVSSSSTSSLSLRITANELPSLYDYRVLLSPSTADDDVYNPTCQLSVLSLTLADTDNQSFAILSSDYAVNTLQNCFIKTLQSDGVMYKGYLVLALEYTEWGLNPPVALYFWQLTVIITNSTQAVSLSTVTSETTGPPVVVHIAPSAILMGCIDTSCTTERTSYFARVGDQLVYFVGVTTGISSSTTTIAIHNLVLEDVNHNTVPVYLAPTILHSFYNPVQGQANITFSFVVPSGTAAARYLHVFIDVDYGLQSKTTIVSKRLHGTRATHVVTSRGIDADGVVGSITVLSSELVSAQLNFAVEESGSSASAAHSPFALTTLILLGLRAIRYSTE